MGDPRTKKTPELIKHMLNELESPSRELTPWEQNFIESVTGQFEERGTLSDAQFSKLEDIYSEKTA